MLSDGVSDDMAGRDAARGAGSRSIELLVVISMISILAAMGLVQYRNSVQRRKEATLQDTISSRCATSIDQYYADKGKYPSSLDSLVSDGYLRKIPGIRSPIGRHVDDRAGGSRSGNPTAEPGVYDVKSGAQGTALDGTAYADF